MAKVCSIADAVRFVEGDEVPQFFVLKAVDSVREAGDMLTLLGASPGCQVVHMGALIYVDAVAGVCRKFLRTARKISSKRRISPAHKAELFHAHEDLAALYPPEISTCKLQYRPRPRRLHGARVLRFLKIKTKRTKAMRGVVRAVRNRIRALAVKIHCSRYLTARLSKILRSVRHDVRLLLKRRVLFGAPAAA